jgi:hypothetical protein
MVNLISLSDKVEYFMKRVPVGKIVFVFNFVFYKIGDREFTIEIRIPEDICDEVTKKILRRALLKRGY